MKLIAPAGVYGSIVFADGTSAQIAKDRTVTAPPGSVVDLLEQGFLPAPADPDVKGDLSNPNASGLVSALLL